MEVEVREEGCNMVATAISLFFGRLAFDLSARSLALDTRVGTSERNEEFIKLLCCTMNRYCSYRLQTSQWDRIQQTRFRYPAGVW